MPCFPVSLGNLSLGNLSPAAAGLPADGDLKACPSGHPIHNF